MTHTTRMGAGLFFAYPDNPDAGVEKLHVLGSFVKQFSEYATACGVHEDPTHSSVGEQAPHRPTPIDTSTPEIMTRHLHTTATRHTHRTLIAAGLSLVLGFGVAMVPGGSPAVASPPGCPTAQFDNGVSQVLDGDGSVGNPCLVGTAEELDAVRNKLNASYKQTANIDLISIPDWSPIGQYSATPFTGNYDGDDFTIRNLTIQPNTSDYRALFGFIQGAGTGVGDGRLDQAAADLGQHHRHRLRPAEPPDQRRQHGDDGHDDQDGAKPGKGSSGFHRYRVADRPLPRPGLERPGARRDRRQARQPVQA